MGKSECKSDRKSDPRKTNLSLSADMLDEIRAAAKHHDASLSWVMQQAWMIARGEIAKMPAAPRRRAVQPCAQTHTMTAAPPRDLPRYRQEEAAAQAREREAHAREHQALDAAQTRELEGLRQELGLMRQELGLLRVERRR